MKNNVYPCNFLSENFRYLVVKFSVYLNRHVFIMFLFLYGNLFYGYSSEVACSNFIYFIVSGEISKYLVKIKVVSITSELISYHFTCD